MIIDPFIRLQNYLFLSTLAALFHKSSGGVINPQVCCQLCICNIIKLVARKTR